MTTTSTEPTWAADVSVCDAGNPDEYTTYAVEFGRQPALDPQTFERDGELILCGFQYSNQQGGLPANTPTIEIRLKGDCALLLTLPDAHGLLTLLADALMQMEATA